ncbi:RND family efflux transporter MFP subunit [Modicisalibacter xianhensis]|uniref:RND family efflux transporter MFP subunit n=1 Tax=Modicisalibacter xianhensis TaxID=442341 RepID=A0A4R8G984_9GAMM|nr:efflux RND transporter periplasmic adaptor subunit [Halomonas xianhensis]TDX32870.1 RND family efflux transporter MFP subunit [Halomonas xianhensis]
MPSRLSYRSPVSVHRQAGRSHWGTLAALLAIALGLGIGYWLLSQPPRVERRAAPPSPAPRVEVVRPDTGAVAPVIQGYGRVVAARQTDVAARVGGRLMTFSEIAEPGRVVEDGAALATLDASDYRLAVRSAEAALAQAEAELAVERGEQIRARSDYESFGRQLSAERRALVLREPQLKSAQAAVDSAKVALESAQLDLARTEITAPYRAMIQERLVGPGSEISANTAVLSLVDVGHFWVRASLPSEELTWLDIGEGGSPGASVRLTSRGWPAGAYREGRVFSVLPDLEESGLLAQVLVRVDDPLALENDAPALRLGDLVNATFEATPREGLIALPTPALRDGNRVWIAGKDDRLQLHRVNVVYRGEERVLLDADDSALNADQRVITSHLGQAREGMALRIADDGQNSDAIAADTREPRQGAASDDAAPRPEEASS